MDVSLANSASALEAVAASAGLVIRRSGELWVLGPEAEMRRPVEVLEGRCKRVDLDFHRADVAELLALFGSVCTPPPRRTASGEVTMRVQNRVGSVVVAQLLRFGNPVSKLPGIEGDNPSHEVAECDQDARTRAVTFGCEPLDSLQLRAIVDDEPARALFVGSQPRIVREGDFIAAQETLKPPESDPLADAKRRGGLEADRLSARSSG